MASSSPPSVLKAYFEQFQSDFSMFLRCRSEELVEEGSMVLTFLGRRCDDPSSKECCYIWGLLAVALNDMVAEVHILFLHALDSGKVCRGAYSIPTCLGLWESIKKIEKKNK